MDPEKDTQNPDDKPEETTSAGTSSDSSMPSQSAPADALSKTPDELEDEAEQAAAASTDTIDAPIEKKVSPLKAFFRKVNVYFLLFAVLLVVAGVIAVTTYLNSQKPPETPNVADQTLTEEALRQLANNDASVGETSQTLTIKGNAVIDGQTLMRGNLNLAGNLQTGGTIQGPTLTISGASNLGDTQINTLQIANGLAVEGDTTLRGLSVAGASTFSGAMTASQLTVTRLILSGNAELQVPNHVSFTGPSPNLATNGGVLGNGGSASINGSDTAGSISINTGNNPSAGCFGRVNFNLAFPSPPRVLISPVGSGASQTRYYVDRDANGFSVCTSQAAPNNQAFGFDYFVSG